MNTDHISSIAKDIDFCNDRSDEQFFSRGRFSMTKMLRTVAMLNSEASRAEFVVACAMRQINANTAAKQFALSRKFSLENFDDVVANPDGSLRSI